jgi:hypothetical protein
MPVCTFGSEDSCALPSGSTEARKVRLDWTEMVTSSMNILDLILTLKATSGPHHRSSHTASTLGRLKETKCMGTEHVSYCNPESEQSCACAAAAAVHREM